LFSLNGDPPSYPGSPFDSSNFYKTFVVEEMIDSVDKVKTTKFVDHKFTEFMSSNAGTWKYHSGPNIVEDTGPNALWWGHGIYPSYTYPFNYESYSTEYSKSLSVQLSETIEKFHSTNEVDNLLNIAEANQIPGTLRSLATTIDRSEVRDALGKRSFRVFSRGVKRVGLRASNSFLAYSFGLAPLLSDMKKMSKACHGLHRDMQKDFSRKSRIDTVSTSQTGSIVGSTADMFPPYMTSERFVPTSPKRHVGVKGVRTQQYNTAVFHRLDYLLRKFGTPGPASFVWEKIPYSFMADWFLNLKGITQELDNLLTGNTKQISDAWMTESSSVFYRTTLRNSNAIIPEQGTIVCSTSLRRFTRTPLIAQRPAVYVSSHFGKKQLALTGALLYQKVAKR